VKGLRNAIASRGRSTSRPPRLVAARSGAARVTGAHRPGGSVPAELDLRTATRSATLLQRADRPLRRSWRRAGRWHRANAEPEGRLPQRKTSGSRPKSSTRLTVLGSRLLLLRIVCVYPKRGAEPIKEVVPPDRTAGSPRTHDPRLRSPRKSRPGHLTRPADAPPERMLFVSAMPTNITGRATNFGLRDLARVPASGAQVS